MKAWQRYLVVGVGSGLGSVMRYAVSLGAQATLGSYFPWGTLLVNVAGSWLIGWLATMATLAPTRWWQPFGIAGFCGGFTTFSMFSVETLHFIEAGKPGLALVYIAVSLPLWLGAAAVGDRMARSYKAYPNSHQP